MAYRYDPILCMNVPVEKPKVRDEYIYVQLRFASGRTEGAKLEPSSFREYAEALLKKYNEKQVTISKNGRALATYINRSFDNSASTVDKAIKACDTNDKKVVRDGMFSKTFSEVTKGAEYKMKHGLSELGKITDSKQFEQVNQTYANELNKSLERLMNTYNVASQDYQNERNNIIDLINQFNKQSMQMYRKLIGK